MTQALLIFTAKSVERIVAEGGSAAWKLDRNNARQCEYAVCTRNSRADWVEGSEAHASAFLVGRVSDIVAAPDRSGRWIVKMSEYAMVDIPSVWQGWRNPIRYTTLEELGIDPNALSFKRMPAQSRSTGTAPKSKRDSQPAPLRIADELAATKRSLAERLGTTPEAIEIIVRG
jgi:hypothetical protein